MIFDNIDNRERYEMSADLSAILDRMAVISEENFPESRIEISESAFINPVRFVAGASSGKYEEHNLYADVHYVLSGRERIMVELPENLSIMSEYSEADDIAFYSGST